MPWFPDIVHWLSECCYTIEACPLGTVTLSQPRQCGKYRLYTGAIFIRDPGAPVLGAPRSPRHHSVLLGQAAPADPLAIKQSGNSKLRVGKCPFPDVFGSPRVSSWGCE